MSVLLSLIFFRVGLLILSDKKTGQKFFNFHNHTFLLLAVRVKWINGLRSIQLGSALTLDRTVNIS